MRRKYRPSNGTEGMGFYENWCDRCRHNRPEDEDGGCKILCRTLMFNVDEPGYPDEWVYDDTGNPTCTAFEAEPGDVCETCGGSGKITMRWRMVGEPGSGEESAPCPDCDEEGSE